MLRYKWNMKTDICSFMTIAVNPGIT